LSGDAIKKAAFAAFFVPARKSVSSWQFVGGE